MAWRRGSCRTPCSPRALNGYLNPKYPSKTSAIMMGETLRTANITGNSNLTFDNDVLIDILYWNKHLPILSSVQRWSCGILPQMESRHQELLELIIWEPWQRDIGSLSLRIQRKPKRRQTWLSVRKSFVSLPSLSTSQSLFMMTSSMNKSAWGRKVVSRGEISSWPCRSPSGSTRGRRRSERGWRRRWPLPIKVKKQNPFVWETYTESILRPQLLWTIQRCHLFEYLSK